MQYRLVQLLSRQTGSITRRRRRGSVDLPLARRRHPQHPRLRARPPGRLRREAGAELPLHRQHPARRQRHHREEQRAAARSASGPESGDGDPLIVFEGGDRARRGRVRRVADRRRAVDHAGAARLRRLLPDQRPVAGAGRRAARARSAVRGRGRHALLRPRRDQGPASPTCAPSPTPTTAWRCSGSSTSRRAGSARPPPIGSAI